MSDIYSDPYRSPAPEGAPAGLPRLTRFAGAAIFLLLVLGMATWAYRLGTRDAAEVPVIRAMEGPARSQPADPGGLQAAHQGLEVNSVLAAAPPPPPSVAEVPPLAPPPVMLAEEDGPQGELVVAVPDFAALAGPDEDDLRMPIGDDDPDAIARVGFGADAAPRATAERTPGEPLTFGADTAPEAGEAASEAVAETAPDAAPDAAAGEADIASLIAALQAEDDAPVAAGPRPRTRPAGHVVRVAATSPQTAPAAQPAFAPASSAPASASTATSAPREVASLNPGTRLVQLGAFDSEAMARQTWNQILGRNGDLLGAKSLFLERATHNARVFYRLRVAGFGSTDETRIMCESLRARGVDCIPVTLN